jgi:hypothetical protein
MPPTYNQSINQQYNTYFKKRFHFNARFNIRWKDVHEITPLEASFCRNNLIRDKLSSGTLSVYDVFARTGSDCLSFLLMSHPHVWRIAANTTRDDQAVLQTNLDHFASAFQRKFPLRRPPLASIQTIPGNWRNMDEQHWYDVREAHYQHELARLDVLYIDPVWNVLQPPEALVKNLAEFVLDPVLELAGPLSPPKLVVIKAWWPRDDMMRLAEKHLRPDLYHHYLTVSFTPFHNPFYMHFFELRLPQNENLLPKERRMVVSGLFHQVYHAQRTHYALDMEHTNSRKYKLVAVR